MAHIPQDKLAQKIKEARQEVEVGSKYAHYKNPETIYKVTGFGVIEASDEIGVLYQAQYGARLTFVRPLASWLEHVEWQGQEVLRFKKI